MAVNTTKYGLRDILYVTFDSLESTGLLLGKFEDVKDGAFTNGQNTVYAQGGVGTPKLLGFDNEISAMLSASNAYITDGLLAIQSGNDVETLTDTTEIEEVEVVTVTSDTATLTYTPTGTTDAEIKYAYVVNSDGSWDTTGTVYEQAAAAASGKFSLSGKVITFNTSEIADGTEIGVKYYPTVSSAKKFTRKTDTFSKTVRATAHCFFVDGCTGEILEGRIVFPKAKVSGNFDWSMDSAGDPSVQNFEVEALKSCASTDLWYLYINDSDDKS